MALGGPRLFSDGNRSDVLRQRWPLLFRRVRKTQSLPVVAASLAVALQALPASALDCLDTGEGLLKIPELRSGNGVLRGTILLTDQQQRLAFRRPPTFTRPPNAPGPNTTHRCVEQYVRTFQVDPKIAVIPKYPGMVPPGYPHADSPQPSTTYPDPIPGPTLRARVGDIVQLTFLNQIDPYNFDPGLTRAQRRVTDGFERANMDPGTTIDRAEKGMGSGCDETLGVYPKGTAALDVEGRPGGERGDTFPNCFHGSTTGNIHFHGTHTSPNTTGDNVFIQVRPSLRKDGNAVVTPESIKKPFDQFFADCLYHLRGDVLRQWPRTWDDLPEAWTNEQRSLLEEYDNDVPTESRLWPPNKLSLDAGLWPLYYIGAFPFCFQLPEYTANTWPPAKAAAPTHVRMGLPADAGRVLQMGQAPGTHWYHGHKHGSTAINVANGLTGAFIIEGKYDDDLNAFFGTIDGEVWTRAQPVLVINQLGVSPNLERGRGRPRMGEDFSVNGRLQPTLTMRPGEVQLWRIVNTSSRSGVYFAKPPAGFSWNQLAQDGVQFAWENYDNPRYRDHSFLLASGNRADLLIKAPSVATTPGEPVAIQVQHSVSAAETSDPMTLLFVAVTGTAVADTDPQAKLSIPKSSYPAFPPYLADITDAEVRGTKIITFNSTGPWHTVDGKLFDDTVGQVVLLNKVEEWKIENSTTFESTNGNINHPFHIHVNPFQVVEVFDPNEEMPDADNNSIAKYVFAEGMPLQPGQCPVNPNDPETWKPCNKVKQSNLVWRDVFPIPSGKVVNKSDGTKVTIPGYFKMRSRFVDYPGWFVMHCHILAHEDRGMMTVVQVAPFTPPVAHH